MSGSGGRRRGAGPGTATQREESLSWRKQKSLQIHRALTSDPVDIDVLRGAAESDGGLLSQEIRRKVWPKLLSVNVFHLPPKPGMRDAERSVLLEQLTDMILSVLQSHPELHYYQGFHDIAVTLLLTVGLRLGTGMLSTLATHHLRDFMDPTMDRTKHILHYLMPLIQSESSELHSFLVRSEVGCIFALSWLITWYSHVLTNYQHILRLYDFFLASHPLMPVYCAAQMVLMREQEVLRCECDMASVHQLLSRIPTHFPYGTLVSLSLGLFRRHPPTRLLQLTSQHKSFSVASFHSLQISSSSQRPDSILQREAESDPPAEPSPPPPPRSQNPLVKLAVWGLSASIGAAALAVAQSALELGPELLMGLF
ncbi:TBC1 domain family member 20-like isoform X2 [Xenopus tropicalis]|uniref:TBC1 domain family member 20-like n=1 Tax=Xenopus tropicalis TaxID=8364 RepID=A0A803JK85_XENTR|nr:TBC1 domain family member 20-like isoform X2 [Xenopus tropicalis]